MQNLIEINIKSEGQTVSQAIGEFLLALDRAKFCKTKIIKVITGYGSHGKGGEIKKELQKLLFNLKRAEKISEYYPCERLTKNELHTLCVEFPDLILDTEISSYNSGVTVVLL